LSRDRWTSQSTPSCPLLRPRLIRELSFTYQNDLLLVSGGSAQLIIDDKNLLNLLPILFSLLDGRHTEADIISDRPDLSNDALHSAIAALYHFGLVEEGAFDQESCKNPQALYFLRRVAASTSRHPNGDSAYRRLSRAKVAIISDSRHSHHYETALRELLVKCGIGEVSCFNRSYFETFAETASSNSDLTMLVVLLLESEDISWLREIDGYSFRSGVPWLRSVLNRITGFSDIGPLFLGDSRPCYECFSRQCLTERDLDTRDYKTTIDAVAATWIAMLGTSIIYTVASLGRTAYEGFKRFDHQIAEIQQLYYTRSSNCSHCCHQDMNNQPAPDPPGTFGPMNLVLLYEENARSQLNPLLRPHSAQLRRPNATGVRQRKLWSSPWIKLDRNHSSLEVSAKKTITLPHPAPCAEITLDKLATLLSMCAGVKEQSEIFGQIKRWAATAGDLGSAELYLVITSVVGLSPGLYYYDAWEHALVLIEADTPEFNSNFYMDKIMYPGPSANVVLLFTGSYFKLRKKYGALSYKLINLDAGVAMGQLHLAARALDIDARTQTVWPDDLVQDLCNLTDFEEQVTGVIGLYDEAHGQAPSKTGVSVAQDSEISSRHNQISFSLSASAISIDTAVKTLYRMSRMRESDIVVDSIDKRASPSSLHILRPSESTLNRLMSGTAKNTFSLRSTVRHYSPAPIGLDQIQLMLWSAAQADVTNWPARHDGAGLLQFLVIARNIEAMTPGAYRYDATAGILVRCDSIRSYPYPRANVDRREFTSASALIWICGNLRYSCGPYGAFGYRELLLRAGMAASWLWWTALSMNLGGGIAAALPGLPGMRESGFNGYGQVGLVAFATGHQA
jgi:SagB-type dehydrogenase family enzyme